MSNLYSPEMPSWRAIRCRALKVPVYIGALPPLARPIRMPICCVCSRVLTTHRGFVTCTVTFFRTRNVLQLVWQADKESGCLDSSRRRLWQFELGSYALLKGGNYSSSPALQEESTEIYQHCSNAGSCGCSHVDHGLGHIPITWNMHIHSHKPAMGPP